MSGIDVETCRKGVLADQRIGYNGQLVAEALARNFENGACQLSFERLADAAMIISGAKPVREAIARLEGRGWLLIERPADANHGRRALRYQPVMPAAVCSSPTCPQASLKTTHRQAARCHPATLATRQRRCRSESSSSPKTSSRW